MAIVGPLEGSDPSSIGGYRLVGRLGSGAMGQVYLAHDGSGRELAIKVIRHEHASDPAFRKRFAREADAAGRIRRTFAAAVVDSDPSAVQPWIALEFVRAPTLGQLVRQHGPLSDGAVGALAVAVAGTLRHVHEVGLVHRDLKPENLLISADGPMLIDFGIAKRIGAVGDGSYIVGSPAYMSPEQALGKQETSPAGDVFSLGSVLFYAATGTHPNWHRLIADGIEVTEPLYPEGMPVKTREIISACHSRRPEDRPSALALMELAQNLDTTSRRAWVDRFSDAQTRTMLGARVWALREFKVESSMPGGRRSTAILERGARDRLGSITLEYGSLFIAAVFAVDGSAEAADQVGRLCRFAAESAVTMTAEHAREHPVTVGEAARTGLLTFVLGADSMVRELRGKRNDLKGAALAVAFWADGVCAGMKLGDVNISVVTDRRLYEVPAVDPPAEDLRNWRYPLGHVRRNELAAAVETAELAPGWLLMSHPARRRHAPIFEILSRQLSARATAEAVADELGADLSVNYLAVNAPEVASSVSSPTNPTGTRVLPDLGTLSMPDE